MTKPGERGRLARCVTRLAGHHSELFGEGAESPSTGGSGRGAHAPCLRYVRRGSRSEWQELAWFATSLHRYFGFSPWRFDVL